MRPGGLIASCQTNAHNQAKVFDKGQNALEVALQAVLEELLSFGDAGKPHPQNLALLTRAIH
jgi:hypothetical protein